MQLNSKYDAEKVINETKSIASVTEDIIQLLPINWCLLSSLPDISKHAL